MTQNIGITALVALLVVGRFLARELRERRISVGRIYLPPAILGVIALALIGMAVFYTPENLLVLALACIAGLAGGAVIGYAVAHFTTVRVTAEPGIIYARGSIATVAIWIVALALRFLARFALVGDALHGRHGGLTLALNAALLVLLASALFFVRYRLVAAAAIERARGIVAASPAI
jgi:hypothetical protein